MRHTWKSAALLEKRDTLGKKCGALGKMRHTWKSAAHLEKHATLGKMRHT